MTDKQLLVNAMNTLKSFNEELIKLCELQHPAFIGFDIEKIKAVDEKLVLENGIPSLQVNLVDVNLYQVMNSWKSFIKADGYSTKFVDRLPGIVVITKNKDQVKSLVDNINLTKSEVASIVRKDRNQYQRHQFIHDTFSMIMTEQVYRDIHYFEHNVTNVWFNWASRPVPKTYSINDAVAMLEEQWERPKFSMSPEEWQVMINKTINDVKSGMFDYIQQVKEYRVLPTVEFQYINQLGHKKRKKMNATTPIILLAQTKNMLPKYSLLKPYKKTKNDREIKLMPNKTYINQYLKLVGVRKI